MYPEWLFWRGSLVIVGHLIGIQVERFVRLGRENPLLSRTLNILGFRIESMAIAGP